MADIYEQHGAAFNRVAAYVVLHDGKHVANVAFKFPADGAGRLYAYVHWLGLEMTRGFAGGYCNRSAAVANATRKMPEAVLKYDAAQWDRWNAFKQSARRDDGNNWVRNLELAGFVVMCAI